MASNNSSGVLTVLGVIILIVIVWMVWPKSTAAAAQQQAGNNPLTNLLNALTGRRPAGSTGGGAPPGVSGIPGASAPNSWLQQLVGWAQAGPNTLSDYFNNSAASYNSSGLSDISIPYQPMSLLDLSGVSTSLSSFFSGPSTTYNGALDNYQLGYDPTQLLDMTGYSTDPTMGN